MLIHGVLPIVAGGAIYILFRSQTVLTSIWVARLLELSPFVILRSWNHEIPQWVIYSLPDGLWLYSLIFLLISLWQGSKDKARYFWMAAGPVLALGSELGQWCSLVPGTFDILDMLFYLIATALAIGQQINFRRFIMKKSLKLSLISLLVLSLFVVMAIGSSGTTEPEEVDNNTDTEVGDDTGNNDQEQETFGIGSTVKMGNLIITLNSARFDQGGEFMSPDEGENWLLLDFTLENTGDEAETISSLMMFTLLNNENYQCDQDIFADTKGGMDDTLGAGRSLRGEISWTVSEDDTSWELVFEPNFWDLGQAIFRIDAEEVQ